jgi:hypothetical protein
MKPLWRALAVTWLGGIGSPALMDDCMLDEQVGVHEQIEAAATRSSDPGNAARCASDLQDAASHGERSVSNSMQPPR